MSQIEFRAFVDDDLKDVGPMMATSFSCKEEEVLEWHKRVGKENVRVALMKNRPAASLVLINMGIWLGGKSVSTLGVQGVATAPEFRGRGVCRAMMRETIREAHAKGTSLSALYASTFRLYRSVGYEFSGGFYNAEVPLNLFPRSRDFEGLTLRRMSEKDHDGIAQCYTIRARTRAGMLDRDSVLWDRVYAPRGKTVEGWIFTNAENLVEGYLIYSVERQGNDLGVIYTLHDVSACTARGWRGLAGFLRSLYSMLGQARWNCGPGDPLLSLLPERGSALKWEEDWMLRVVNIESALCARGWSSALQGEVHFRFSDDVIDDNNGRFVLTVDKGRVSVKAGGDGRLCMDINGLAPLYTGCQSAEELQMSGLISGADKSVADDESLAMATALFAGPTPSMPDMF